MLGVAEESKNAKPTVAFYCKRFLSQAANCSALIEENQMPLINAFKQLINLMGCLEILLALLAALSVANIKHEQCNNHTNRC